MSKTDVFRNVWASTTHMNDVVNGFITKFDRQEADLANPAVALEDRLAAKWYRRRCPADTSTATILVFLLFRRLALLPFSLMFGTSLRVLFRPLARLLVSTCSIGLVIGSVASNELLSVALAIVAALRRYVVFLFEGSRSNPPLDGISICGVPSGIIRPLNFGVSKWQ